MGPTQPPPAPGVHGRSGGGTRTVELLEGGQALDRAPRGSPGGGGLNVAHHPQHVAAGEPRQVASDQPRSTSAASSRGYPVTSSQPVGSVSIRRSRRRARRGRSRRPRGRARCGRRHRRAVARARGASATSRRANASRPPASLGSMPGRAPAAARLERPRGALGVHERRHEGHHADAAVAGQPGQHVVGDVARVVGDRPRRGVAEDHRRLGGVERRAHRRRRRRGRGRPSCRAGSSRGPPRRRTASGRRRRARRSPSRPTGCCRCG